MKRGNVWIAVALISAAACGGSASTAPAGNGNTNPAPGNTNPTVGGISVTNNAFTPDAKTVAVGTSVQWAWDSCSGDVYSGQTCVSHNVVFDDGTTSGLQSQGTFSRTFTVAGTYNYHCAVHGLAMKGTIIVQ
jgi:plastocyanin